MKAATRRRMFRVGVTLLPLVFALLHALSVLPLGMVLRLDHILYDARLRLSMPATLDPRIVIVDIDEKSLAELGHWPWSRDKLAALIDELHERQKVRVTGFDIVFPEADESSGLKQLQQLAATDFKNQPGFTEALRRLEPALDHDAAFARAIKNRPVVLGYYFTSDREGRTSGELPAPAMERSLLQGRDAVNLASRLEDLGKNYGVEIVASESTRLQATDFVWQEIDTVRVKGREAPVAIFNPLLRGSASASPAQTRELRLWQRALHDYRAQDWAHSQLCLTDLIAENGEKYLYAHYAKRVACKINSAFDPRRDEMASLQPENPYAAPERIAS